MYHLLFRLNQIENNKNTNTAVKMVNNSIKIISCIATLLFFTAHQNEATKTYMKYARLKCNYKCMNYFEECSSLCKDMESYVMCFREQGRCRLKCKEETKKYYSASGQPKWFSFTTLSSNPEQYPVIPVRDK